MGGGSGGRGKYGQHLWLIHFVEQQKPTQQCKAIILQRKRKKGRKEDNNVGGKETKKQTKQKKQINMVFQTVWLK